MERILVDSALFLPEPPKTVNVLKSLPLSNVVSDWQKSYLRRGGGGTRAINNAYSQYMRLVGSIERLTVRMGDMVVGRGQA